MAQIEYQSMFIPTNMNLMQQNIGRREDEYNQNEAAIAATEDQYANIVSDPTAVEYKNNLLTGFKTDVNKMIDQYGGDIGAIDKRSLISKMNSIRPEIQAIQRHAALKEEERQAINKLGPWALKLGASAIKDSRGNVIGEPVSAIKDKRAYLEYMQENYAKLANKVRESGLKPVNGVPGLLESTTQRGIYENEEDALIDQATQALIDLDPDLANRPEVANDLAKQYIPQLYQGYTKEYVDDPLAKLNARKNNPDSMLNYIIRNGAGEDNKVTKASLDEAKKQYLQSKSIVSEIEKARERRKKDGVKPSQSSQFPGAIDPLAAESAEYESNKKATTDYINSLGEGVVGDLMVNYGYPEEKAIEIAEKNLLQRPIEHPGIIRPSAKISKENLGEAIRLASSGTDYGQLGIINENGEKDTSGRDKYEKNLKKAMRENKIKDFEINMKTGEVMLHSSEDGNTYVLPATAFGDRGVSEAMRGYVKLQSALQNNRTASASVNIGGTKFVATKSFNPKTELFEDNIFILDDESKTKIPVTSEQLNHLVFSNIFASYGLNPEYKQEYIND